MFKRLPLEEHTTACLTIAFVTAVTIFFGFAWRALRMSRAQVDRFAQLPFAPETSDQPAAPDPAANPTTPRT
ncbi:hypothetical protein [Opitutus terrae]|uniref:Cbb3-type cytochrome oxidase component n=1 Tax=Opitutus terrae (strain DSM 11246 / JCM 15787 / PB90-1) TaxID=452637 RepID=B2A016_OPITP|nr:hypothetical protein [Opitutus terrae]ACB77352.1 hypothetical protein Oter_4078 [Opitutus terrae PB90-1]